MHNLQVSDTITLTPNGNATATLRTESGGHAHEITLTLVAFSPRPSLSGASDGVPFA
ncbi:hypothetical protein [Sinosporangium siamense]|uniref:Uncharacterized protein n=1 Tax=Sinosporangium siamense TaxID=1367973 RepID=A0A919V766_9ACTN|nr:hypothetical protein [Sinosporangium siamense]GII91772.1 hypothetical protein Ssi02_20030 [Sinosporangium siamense]